LGQGQPKQVRLNKGLGALLAAVFSNPGMSLEQPEIDDAKRVDLL
jgi:hypothetical protein